jgi:hypothetical protein
MIAIGASCFENICTKYHMLSLTNRDSSFYCYGRRCIFTLKFKLKFMQDKVREW